MCAAQRWCLRPWVFVEMCARAARLSRSWSLTCCTPRQGRCSAREAATVLDMAIGRARCCGAGRSRQSGRVWWTGCGKRGADLLHEAQRARWAPHSENPNGLVGGVGKGVPGAERTLLWCFGTASLAVPNELVEGRFGLITALNKHTSGDDVSAWRDLPDTARRRQRAADPTARVRQLQAGVRDGFRPYSASSR